MDDYFLRRSCSPSQGWWWPRGLSPESTSLPPRLPCISQLLCFYECIIPSFPMALTYWTLHQNTVTVKDKWFSCVLAGEAQYVWFLLKWWFIISYIFINALLDVNIGIFLLSFQKAGYCMGREKNLNGKFVPVSTGKLDICVNCSYYTN